MLAFFDRYSVLLLDYFLFRLSGFGLERKTSERKNNTKTKTLSIFPYADYQVPFLSLIILWCPVWICNEMICESPAQTSRLKVNIGI